MTGKKLKNVLDFCILIVDFSKTRDIILVRLAVLTQKLTMRLAVLTLLL